MKPVTTSAVHNIFSPSVSRTYEVVNHMLTFGLDVLWRRRAARIGAKAGGTQWADMCTGTGEMAVYLRRFARPEAKVYAIDFSRPMIDMAKKKSEARDIIFIVSDVTALEFPDDSFDLITISFATRNINLNKDALIRTFAEFCRVLKPGGRFVNLETSQPSSRLTRWLFYSYVRLFVNLVGGLISGSYSGYAYLRHTIPRFYPPEELLDIMCRAGFTNVTYRTLMFGVAAIHQGMKG